MTRESIATVLKALAVTFLWGLILFADGIWNSSSGFLGTITREVTAACRDSQTQWMVVLCLASYFVLLLFLERRLDGSQSSESGGRIAANTEIETKTHTSPRTSPLPAGAERERSRGRERKSTSNSTPHPTLSPNEAERAFSALPAFFRGNIFNPNLWLGALVVLALVRYACDYEAATHSMQLLVLLAGIVFGKAAAVWVAAGSNIRHQSGSSLSPHEERAGREPERGAKQSSSPHPSPPLVEERVSAQRMSGIVIVLIALLAASALWQPETRTEFQYRGVQRWNGVWNNPNTFGLLMAVGFILAVGQFMSLATRHPSHLLNGEHPTSNSDKSRAGIEHPTSNLRVRRCAIMLAFLVAAGLCGFGLFKSYSRGAWLGAFLGLGYLVCQVFRHQVSGSSKWVSWLRRHWRPLSVILASVMVLAFWQFRYTEWRPARRVFSVSNVNDFSWRNRVTAWKGAARMMADRPLIGFGWGRAESAYREKYCRLEDTAAIQMNDFFTLGISTGVPALLCFAAYAAFSLRRKLPESNSPSSIFHLPSSLSATCRAGSIVMLVGFWFDGGLFKLSTATIFWILMEMGSADSLVREPHHQKDERTRLSALRSRRHHSGWETGLRWLAGILAGLAVALTAVNLGTPLLPTGDGTLFMARKFIVPSNERDDFEFLSANPLWRGKKLKTLLEHVQLAHYNRQLTNWKLDESPYREFVLSPTIDSVCDGEMNWRRTLWEFFYPRVRKESSPEAAAEIVVRLLSQRVVIDEKAGKPLTIEEMWRRQITDKKGFEIICVAALRSVGVPARLGANGRAEFFSDGKWQPAPRPAAKEQ